MAFVVSPRAVRNDNPGNLRKGIAWAGLSMLRSDPDYCVFIDAAEGFRALAIDLHTKWAKDGLVTIAAIIGKYAPPSENDTAAYIKNVSEMMGVEPDVRLDLGDPKRLCELCRAIAVHESGGWFFSLSDLNEGVRLTMAQ